MIYFDEIDLAVKPKGAASYSGILADRCSLNISNSVQENYSIGRTGALGASANGPAQASINFSYFVETASEPCFEVVRLLKNHHTTKCDISFAGTTGTFYLSNYSLASAPNDTIKATADFSCFDLVTGKNLGKFSRHNSTINYNTSRSTANGWATYLVETGISGRARQNPTLGLSYSFNAKHEPMYCIGNQVPSQVDFMGGQEQLKTIKTELYNAHQSGISGQHVDLANTGTFSGEAYFSPTLLSCNNGMSDSTLEINLSGHTINQTQINSQVSDLVLTTISSEKYF